MAQPITHKTERRVIGISDMAISSDPGEMLVTYSLGSCLGVVLYDYVSKIGAISHFMLPEANLEKLSGDSVVFNSFKFVDTGLPLLLKDYYSAGASEKTTCVGVYGGAKLFDHKDMFNIGRRNFAECKKILWKKGLLINHKHVGGTSHRTVKLYINSGMTEVIIDKENKITHQCGR